MKSLTLTALVLLSFPSFVFSQMDVGAVAASLPDEASECRFLLNLCQSYKRLHKESEERMRMYQRDRMPENLSAAGAASELATKTLLDVGSAAQVIRAKHDKMPSCFQECGLLDLERFR